MPGNDRPVLVPGPNGTQVFVDPSTLPSGQDAPQGVSAAQWTPEQQATIDAQSAALDAQRAAKEQELVALAAANAVKGNEPETVDLLAQRGFEVQSPLSPQELANTPQMSTGPGGQPVFVDPGQGPLSEAALQQGVGGPQGLQTNELTSTGVPSQVSQQPQVADPRAAMIQQLQNMGMAAPSRPQVSTGPGGVPTVEEAAPPRPPLTDEQRKALSEAELMAWDDPGVDDAAMVGLMQQQEKLMRNMGSSAESAQAEIAAAHAAHEQQLNDNATQIRESMEETIAETQRMQDDMQSRVDSLYSQRFDPRSIFSSPDAAASFSLHTGYAAGAMIQSLQATNFPGSNPVNVASRVIDQVIEADIARQRESFRRGEGKIRQGFAAIEARRRLGVSEVDALEFARSSAEEEVAQQMSRIAAQYRGTRAAQALDQAANQYRLSAMGRRSNITATSMALASQQAMSNQRRRGQAATPTAGAPLSYFMDEIPNRNPRQEANFQEYLALTPHQRTGIRNQITAVGTAMQLTDRLLHVLQTEGGAVQVDAAMRGRVAGLQTALTAAIKKAETLGALDNGVIELVDRMIGSHDDIFHLTSGDAARLMTYRNSRRRELNVISEEWGQSINQGRVAQDVESTETLLGSFTETSDGDGTGAVTASMSDAGEAGGNQVIDAVGAAVSGVADFARAVVAPFVEGLDVPERDTVTPEEATRHPRGRFM